MDENKQTEAQLTQLGLSKKDLEETIELDSGKFTIKILYPYEKSHVVRLISDQAGNVSNLFQEEADYVRMICTLMNCIVDSPDWFPGASECLDVDLLNDLFGRWEKLELALKAKLKKNKSSKSKQSN